MSKGQVALIVIVFLLAVAGICVWQFWTPISNWFVGAWQTICGWFGKGAEATAVIGL